MKSKNFWWSKSVFFNSCPQEYDLYVIEILYFYYINARRKKRLVNILAAALRIKLNIDVAPVASRSHTHLSHSQPSRLLSSSLSFGLPFPRSTQCVRGF